MVFDLMWFIVCNDCGNSMEIVIYFFGVMVRGIVLWGLV